VFVSNTADEQSIKDEHISTQQSMPASSRRRPIRAVTCLSRTGNHRRWARDGVSGRTIAKLFPGVLFPRFALVERVTRMTMLVHIVGARTAEQLKEAMICRFNELPAHLRLSLTWDQGIEIAAIMSSQRKPVFPCSFVSPTRHRNGQVSLPLYFGTSLGAVCLQR
jgi:hypothetical protein